VTCIVLGVFSQWRFAARRKKAALGSWICGTDRVVLSWVLLLALLDVLSIELSRISCIVHGMARCSTLLLLTVSIYSYWRYRYLSPNTISQPTSCTRYPCTWFAACRSTNHQPLTNQPASLSTLLRRWLLPYYLLAHFCTDCAHNTATWLESFLFLVLHSPFSSRVGRLPHSQVNPCPRPVPITSSHWVAHW